MSLTRDQSNLELLSYTATWKNAMDKVGPQEKASEASEDTTLESWAEDSLHFLRSFSGEALPNAISPPPHHTHDAHKSAFDPPRKLQPTEKAVQPPPKTFLPTHNASTESIPTMDISEPSNRSHSSKPTYDELLRRVYTLQQQHERDQLEIHELRQRLAVKDKRSPRPITTISQIPFDQMKELMDVYGSETCDASKRRDNIKHSSLIRQFRRWNPHFFEFFTLKDDKWEPVLGLHGELERRHKARAAHRTASKKRP